MRIAFGRVKLARERNAVAQKGSAVEFFTSAAGGVGCCGASILSGTLPTRRFFLTPPQL